MSRFSRRNAVAGRWRMLFVFLTVTAMESTCSTAQLSTPHKSQDISEGKTPEPAFLDCLEKLQGSYELTVEMKLVSKNETYIVREVRQRAASTHGLLNNNGTVILERRDVLKKSFLYYYPESNVVLEEEHGTCKQYGLIDYPLKYWGWLYEDQNTREIIIGPSTILRSLLNTKVQFISKEDDEGTKYEVRKSYEEGNDVEVFYYFPKPPEDGTNFPPKREKLHGLPVRFDINFMDRSERIQYNLLSFHPYVVPAALKETTPKSACAGVMKNILRDLQLPKLPDKFSCDQEVVEYSYNGDSATLGQLQLNLHITHSQNLGFTRLDIITQNTDDAPHDSTVQLKVIKDYGAGFEYVINSEFGNCSRSELSNSFLGYHFDPVALLRWDESFSFKGKSNARGIDCNLWTSSRSDIPDPDTGGFQSYPRVDLELCLAKGPYNTPEGAEGIDIPIRSNLLIYSSSDAQKVQKKLTTNFYNFQLIRRLPVEIFSISECLVEHDNDSASSSFRFPGYQSDFKTVDHRDEISYKAEDYGQSVKLRHRHPRNESDLDPDMRFTAGDMIGVACGMILLGIMMSGAFLVIIVITGPKNFPEDKTPSDMVRMSFVNLKTAQGESES